MVAAFGGGAFGGIIIGMPSELILLIITSIMVRTKSTFYSSSIHYPSLITLVICCIIISLLALNGRVDAENNINKVHKQYSKTGFLGSVLNEIHKTNESTAQWDK